MPAALGSMIISAPAARKAASLAASGTAAAIQVPPPASTRAAGSVSRRLSTTMRRGWRGVSTARTLSCGSSALTVPMPVRMAQARARQAWPSARASAPVIHWLWPLCRAVMPSRLAALFMRTHGRPRRMREKKPMFSS